MHRRIGQSSLSDTTIVVVGAQSTDAVVASLRNTFTSVFRDLASLHDQRSNIAVGIFDRSDEESITTFANWARTADVPGVCAILAGREAVLCPMAIRGRAGCARCAWERMLAASDLEEWNTRDPLMPRVAVQAGRALVEEIRSLLRHGAEHSQLVDHVLAVGERARDAALHKVIPVGRCRVCGGAEAFPAPPQKAVQLSADDSPEAVFEKLAGWIDQRTGVISDIYLEPPVGAGLPLIATCAPPRIIEADGSVRMTPVGWGKGLTVSGALISAAGEAIERYSASLPDARKIVWERADDLDTEFIDPRDLSLYSDSQYERRDFPYVPFDRDVRNPWIRGNWFGSEDPVWVPAVFALLSLELRPEHLISQGSSNGLAASTSGDDASLRATLELVERDAFMSSWLTGQPGSPIQLDDTLDPRLSGVVAAVEALGATVETYLLPRSASGTTILCLALGDGVTYPGVTLGLGASLDPMSAVTQAILELGQTGPYLQRMMRTGMLPVPDEPAAVHEMLQHAAYYFPADRAGAFNRVRGRDGRTALRDLSGADVPASIAGCASQLKAAGVRVATVDVTSADVAAGPFRVVRAVSPDLQPIWYGYGFDRQPVPRVRAQGVSVDLPAIHPIM